MALAGEEVISDQGRTISEVGEAGETGLLHLEMWKEVLIGVSFIGSGLD